ncbi:MAG: hypothetical protein AMXMBFR48_06730 [Ignavibacteriales bacterium]|jgi:tRNA-dihydrouridine synthase B
MKIGSVEIEKGILLAPMEDITDISFRLVCRELGADMVYTEFVNAEGIVRKNAKTHKKLEICDEERPVGIQIYGGELKSMIGAAEFAASYNPDLLDINAGCWVKNVVGNGAGAALLKEPVKMQSLIKEIVDALKIPVTVKTRIGWDEKNINIIEIAQRLEDAGIAALTVHCRTRTQGHNGEADWSWIDKIKQQVKIPIILNGSVFSAQDVQRAFAETGADAVMIARGAIGHPWVFTEAKELLKTGKISTVIDIDKRISTCLRHLKLAIDVKGERRAVIEHRKFYSGYMKGMRNISSVRSILMTAENYDQVEEMLRKYQANPDAFITQKTLEESEVLYSGNCS